MAHPGERRVLRGVPAGAPLPVEHPLLRPPLPLVGDEPEPMEPAGPAVAVHEHARPRFPPVRDAPRARHRRLLLVRLPRANNTNKHK